MPAARRVHLILALVAGCWTTKPRSDTPIENRTTPAPASRWRITPDGLAPLTASSVAAEADLKKLLPGLRIAVRDLGESGVVYDAFDGDERVFYVVPDDAATTIFALFATSGRVAVEGRTWRVGEPFLDAKGIDHCECWGNDDVTTCFRIGTHVRLVFEESCARAREDGPAAMRGHVIGRIMWKRVLEPAGLLDD